MIYNNVCLTTIHLGGPRYIVVDDDYDVFIRDEKNTKRAHFSGSRWARFVSEIPMMDRIIERVKNYKPTDFKCHLGGTWHVSINDRFPVVDFRRWYMKNSVLHPTTMGIALTHGQWEKLKNAVEQIEKEVPQLTAISACWHDEPEDTSKCRECNPYEMPLPTAPTVVASVTASIDYAPAADDKRNTCDCMLGSH